MSVKVKTRDGVTNVDGEMEGVRVVTTTDEDGFSVFDLYATDGRRGEHEQHLLTVRGGISPDGNRGIAVEPGDFVNGILNAVVGAMQQMEKSGMESGLFQVEMKGQKIEGIERIGDGSRGPTGQARPSFAPGSIGDLITKGGI